MRRFRWLLLAISGGWVVALVIASGYQYQHLLAAVPYLRVEEEASLTYFIVWLAVSALAFLVAVPRKGVWLSYHLCLLLVAEASAQIYFYATHHHLRRPIPESMFSRFDPHPFVLAVLHPGVFENATHDEEGRRLTINQDKLPQSSRVYVFGGSTTYDSGNTDADTWPSQLSRLLGKNFTVENYGVPGFSSLENMMQSLFSFRGLPPACAIYYEGWNDLRNSNVTDLRTDYSGYEVPYLTDVLLPHRPGFLETNSLLVTYFMSIFASPATQAVGAVSGDPDVRLAKIYQDNIRLIANIGHTFGVRVIFIPQVMNYAILTKDAAGLSMPLVKDKDVRKLMASMNADLAEAAGAAQAYFVGVPLSVKWVEEDFVDQGHFSSVGAVKFAQTIAESVRRICS